MIPSTPVDPHTQHHEILIVAEHVDDALLLEAILHASDFRALHCIVAVSLEEAREHLESTDFDVAVVHLGHADLCSLKRLHAVSATQRAPVVVVAARDDEWLRRQAMKLGAVDFVPEHHVVPKRLARAMYRALQFPFHARRPAVVNPAFDAHLERAHDDAGSIGTILDDVCRTVHDRYAADVHIIAESSTVTLAHTHATKVRAALESLLVGLSNVCRELDAGGLKLHIRTGATANAVLVSIDAISDQRCVQVRDTVLDALVGQSDAVPLEGHLAKASAALRDLGGIVRCRACDDERLWVQVSLPYAPPKTARSVDG